MILRATILAAVILAAASTAMAQAAPTSAPATSAPASAPPSVSDVIDVVNKATNERAARDWAAPVKLALVFAGLALLPSLLVMMTSFTRIIIVLGFVRRALTTQSIPPTVALVGLAIFLTFFTMNATFTRINQIAVQPYLKDKIDFTTAAVRSNEALKEFMVRQTDHTDLEFFQKMAGTNAATSAELPTYVAIPAFAISEFRTGFKMGCLLFIPFLLVDLVISGILLSAGMMMLPPAMISLPFKIILFVLVDGWQRLSETLVRSFVY